MRLQSTELFGTLVSAASGSATLNLQAIENWPASVYNFAGNGVSAGQDPTAANYLVNTGALPVTAAAGDPLWIDGFTSPFGTAPPDFIAEAVNTEANVPASMDVVWSGTGTAAPFATLTAAGLTIDLANAAFASGQLRFGADSIDIKTLSATPMIVPAVAQPAANGLPLFNPLFSVGPGAISESTTAAISVIQRLWRLRDAAQHVLRNAHAGDPIRGSRLLQPHRQYFYRFQYRRSPLN